jgi:hypothetical protein
VTPTPVPTIINFGCEEYDETATLLSLDGNAIDQRKLALRAIDRVVKGMGRNSSSGRKALRLKPKVQALYVSEWSHVWSIPAVFSQCTNQQFCVTVSHAGTIEAFNKDSAAMLDLTNQIVALMSKSMQKRRENQTLLRDANELHVDNLGMSATIPSSSSACSVPK